MQSNTLCLYVDGTARRTWAEGGVLGGPPKWKHAIHRVPRTIGVNASRRF